MNNIPARHPMATGIKNAQEPIAQLFASAVRGSWKKGLANLSIYYNRVGITASNSIKKVINSQENMDPPADATLARRRWMGFKGEKALIVTGQLRNSVTYVVYGEY